MNRKLIRWSLIIGNVAVALILAVQIYFVQNAFDQEKQALNQRIQIALRNVAAQMAAFNETQLPNENPVKQLSPDYFVVNVNAYIDADILEHYLMTEFKARAIELDFEFGIYDCQTEEFVYGRFVTFGDRKKKAEDYYFSSYPDYLYYFGIYFPHQAKWIVSNMGIWYFFSGVLLLVVVFFVFTQMVILRQRRLSEIQRDFINNLTHEFRTPLSSILMSAEVLADPETQQEQERLKIYTRIIKDQSQHILSQIDRILNQSRFQSGKQQLNKSNFDLKELVSSVVEQFSPILKGKGTCRMTLTEQAVHVSGNPQMIRQVLFNLMDNAVKYSGENCTIDIRLRQEKKYWILEIEDQGMGIPVEYQKTVFRRFFRVPQGNVHDVKGFGLGLHYVKRVIAAHGWKIAIESVPDQGTMVRIKI